MSQIVFIQFLGDECHSAGYIYNKIADTAFAKIKYVLKEKCSVICELINE